MTRPPTIPGLDAASDAARLRLVRRSLQECAALLELRASGPPAHASAGLGFGGPSLRAAASALERAGLLPPDAVALLSASASSSILPFAVALSLAADEAHALMSGRAAPLLASGGPVGGAVIPSLVRKASFVVAEVALHDAAAAASAAECAACLGVRRRAPDDLAAIVARSSRRWGREAEDADPGAAIAAHRAAARASLAAAARVALRMRQASSRRRRRASKPRP